MTTRPHPLQADYNRDVREPFWAAAEELGLVLAFHIGTDPIDLSESELGITFRGPGGAILNYTETTYSGQRVATKLVTSGALDRHPDLKVLIAEGGSAWVPSVAAVQHLGYDKVCWGSDYPHLEGTFGHTQKTLHELLDGVSPAVAHRITQGAFGELFPSVPAPPAHLGQTGENVQLDRGLGSDHESRRLRV